MKAAIWRPKVLEPSAGKGKLAAELQERLHTKVDCCELNLANRTHLINNGFNVIGNNFLYKCEFLQQDYYDLVVAVPPYKDNIDTTHIQRMYAVCRKGGSVISLTLPYWITGFFTAQREFRQWLQDKDYRIEILPEEESYLSCPKAIIVITK